MVTATATARCGSPRFHCSLGSLFLLHLLLLFLPSPRTVALLCLSSTLHSFVLFRAPLEGLIAAHTRSPFVSSFCHLFSTIPLTPCHQLRCVHFVSSSATNERAESYLLFTSPLVFPSVLSRTSRLTCHSVFLSRGKRSVFIIVRLSDSRAISSSPLAFLADFLSQHRSSARFPAQEKERRVHQGQKGGGRFNASTPPMTFDASRSRRSSSTPFPCSRAHMTCTCRRGRDATAAELHN